MNSNASVQVAAPGSRLSFISSMATREFLGRVVHAWSESADIQVNLESVGGIDAARRVQDGEVFDIVVLASDAMELLITAGRIVGDSLTPLALSDVAIAVRAGAVRPDISTEDALRRAVMAARRVGYSTGPSGRALQSVFTRWGIAETMRGRLVQAPPGVAVATLIAADDVDIGFQQHSELIGRDGIDIVGTLPPSIQIVTTFSGATCTTSPRQDAARALLAHLRSSAADDARRACGLSAA